MATSVMLVDDNPTFLRLAMMFLAGNDEIQVVGSLREGGEVVERARELNPDVVLIDLTMGEVHGMDMIPKLREAMPEVGIVTLTLHDTSAYREAALAAGADRFVAKSRMYMDLMPAISEIGTMRGDGVR